MSLPVAYVFGGSNLQPDANLRIAAREMKARWPGVRFSACWRNEPVGFTGEPFINFCASLPLAGSLEALKAELEAIEALCGRPPNAPKWEPRPMDLDILMLDSQVLELPGLVIPRPDLLRWSFMLGPLAEIAPDLWHPVAQATIGELWGRFDQGKHPLERVPLDLAVA